MHAEYCDRVYKMDRDFETLLWVVSPLRIVRLVASIKEILR